MNNQTLYDIEYENLDDLPLYDHIEWQSYEDTIGDELNFDKIDLFSEQ